MDSIHSSQFSMCTRSYDVMISYNWGIQEIALRIRDVLEEENISVWMDVTNMVGNMNKRMAEAVQNSRLFIACLSKAYEASRNCNKEIKHADYLNRKIIPVVVEEGYRSDPSSQVALLVGSVLYYDLAREFEKQSKNLVLAVKTYLHQFSKT